MTVVNDSLDIETRGDGDMIDLTDRLTLLLQKQKMKRGHMLVFVPGSTAALTTIEYEPGLKKDFTLLMDRLVPRNARYFHEETWNDGNGHAHVRASMLGPSLAIPFDAGKMMLGTWQQIILIDYDNRPRSRSLVVQFTGE
ncbi:secondary thiamine-phosphate synthase enzyme YjbQ [bacterium]|nr:secondary thiamine-phosphate synthase enzyme YjbQ [bacterium]